MNFKNQFPGASIRSLEKRDRQLLALDQSYPCPVCRHGKIEPITLTEAWGCDRCRQIFERRAESNTIGKLSTPPHRPRSWRWDGQQWVLEGKPVGLKFSGLATVAALGFFLWIVLSRLNLSEIVLAFLLGMTVVVSLWVVMFWVLRRR